MFLGVGFGSWYAWIAAPRGLSVLSVERMAEKHLESISASRFHGSRKRWILFIARFPPQDNYLAWANFEFVADDGTINEVDLRVASSSGFPDDATGPEAME